MAALVCMEAYFIAFFILSLTTALLPPLCRPQNDDDYFPDGYFDEVLPPKVTIPTVNSSTSPTSAVIDINELQISLILIILL